MSAEQPDGGISLKPVPECHILRGGTATGKTQRLLDRVKDLLLDDVEPQGILVVAATPGAAAVFERRLARLSSLVDVSGVVVCNPRDLALRVLARERVMAQTGRKPRILLPFEEDFLVEDLKLGGVAIKRMYDILKFFYKSMTEFADLDPEFLVDGDEMVLMENIKSVLACTGGVLECEASELAVLALRALEGEAAQIGFKHVLVDDMQYLCRATQVLASELAQESIWVSGDQHCSLEVFERFPFAGGLAELEAANDGAVVEELVESYAVAGAVSAANCLRTCADVDGGALVASFESSQEAPVVCIAANPADEMEVVVELVEDALAQGVAPEEVFVWAPHGAWCANVAKALRSRGIGAATMLGSRSLSGDFRSLDGCVSARVASALLYMADNSDMVALRSLLGFGDYLANSNGLFLLREYAQQNGLALSDALKVLGTDAVPEMPERETKLLTEAVQVVESLKAVRPSEGDDLLELVVTCLYGPDAEVPRQLRAMCAPFADGSLAGGDAAALAARLSRRSLMPQTEQLGGQVAVGDFPVCVGMRISQVVACGFVNGFVPKASFFDPAKVVHAKVGQVHGANAKRIMGVVGKARVGCAFTAFTNVPLEQAVKLGLKIDRIALQNKVKVAQISPSIFLEEMGLVAAAK